MITLRTNLSSIITQNSLTNSTNKLNQAIERMSTGYKINHASDNAANYSISTNMNTQLNAYEVAQDNISMGLDLVGTASDTVSELQQRGERLMDLWTQAQNGTYGEDSINAIQSEVNALVSEINRLYANTEYNGEKLFQIALPDWAQEMMDSVAKNNGFIDDVHEITPKIIVSVPKKLEDAINNLDIIGIDNAETLAELTKIVNGTDGYDANSCVGKTFVLMNDIDISSICAANIDKHGYGGWISIGIDDTHGFKGNFFGNGHKISGLYINNIEDNDKPVGLFGYTAGSILDLGLENVDVTGCNKTGSLAAVVQAEVINCYSTGRVTSIGNAAGGLVGILSDGIVEKCYSTADVIDSKDSKELGGLVGVSLAGRIERCFTTGNVLSSRAFCGGISGFSDNRIETCFTTGNITGENAQGICGECVSDDIYDCACVTPQYGGKKVEQIKATSTLQVGINGNEDSQVSFCTKMNLNLSVGDIKTNGAYNSISNFMNKLNAKAVELGAVQNRLESALESTAVNIENLTSSRSTLRDADIAKESSEYIKAQILQQAAATLMSTANQSPAIALQLI